MLQVYKQTKSLFLNLCTLSFDEGGSFGDNQKENLIKKELGDLKAGLGLGLNNGKDPYGKVEIANSSKDWAYLLSLTGSERIREIWVKYGHRLGGRFDLAVEANYLMSKQKFDFTKYGSVDTFLSQIGVAGELNYKKEGTNISLTVEYVKAFRKKFAEKTKTWEDADYTYVETLFAGFTGAERWKFVLELEKAIGSGTVVKGGILYSILKEPAMYDFKGNQKSALGFKASIEQVLSESVKISAGIEKNTTGTQYVGKITHNGKDYSIYIEGAYLTRSDSQLKNDWRVGVGVQIPFGGDKLSKQEQKIAEFDRKFKEMENGKILQYVQSNPALLKGADNNGNLVLKPRNLPENYVIGGRFAQGSQVKETEKPKEDAETSNNAPTVSDITETSVKAYNNISDTDGIQNVIYYLLDANGNPISQNDTGIFTGLTAKTTYKVKTSAEVKNGATGQFTQIISPYTRFETSEAPNQAPVTTADTYTTAYNTAKTLNPLANDSDPEGETLTLVSVTGTNGGTFTKNGNQVDFVPTPGFVGLATATYTVSDGVNQKTENISVTVEAEPVVAPTAENFSLNDKLSPLTIDMTAHTTGATSITIISHLDPSFTITVSGMNINVTIPRGYNGDDRITYQATGPGGTTQGDITIMNFYAE
ncbi:cadherin-like domain-containing protein [Candidatus Gracilibacteria bacterium]|nr:cadherin-like domain-containing protein [Candidatus Gracilibacteria bacterium]NUJ98952.1 cadherin-like domain-containing protein [Candidatus Gracilibacteria bacterium]